MVWSDVARRLTVAALTSADEATLVPLNTCYIAPARGPIQAQAAAAWLNSTWIRVLARLAAVPASGGFARFNARVVGELPLPPAALCDSALAEIARREPSGGSGPRELDNLVAQHLDLSPSAQRTLSALADSGSVNHR